MVTKTVAGERNHRFDKKPNELSPNLKLLVITFKLRGPEGLVAESNSAHLPQCSKKVIKIVQEKHEFPKRVFYVTSWASPEEEPLTITLCTVPMCKVRA